MRARRLALIQTVVAWIVAAAAIALLVVVLV